jgi:hypothetical protein
MEPAVGYSKENNGKERGTQTQRRIRKKKMGMQRRIIKGKGIKGWAGAATCTHTEPKDGRILCERLVLGP